MLKRKVLLAVVLTLFAPVLSAQSTLQVFQAFRAQPNDLARYQYLTAVMPQLVPEEQVFARQLLAFVDANLGLYQQAVQDFPFDNRLSVDKPLPRPDSQSGFTIVEVNRATRDNLTARRMDALDSIVRLATNRHIFIINEAHHNAQSRLLTLALLPRLRALGYDYFAPEALTEDGTTLRRRGYPLESSGTEYLREPLYGDILRGALALGYTIVPYDTDISNPAVDRDTVQASNLYERVFAKDPSARLFVHLGYAHGDKKAGYLGNFTPMALQLWKLSGQEPLTVDQTQFWDALPQSKDDIYHALIRLYRPGNAMVLEFLDSGAIWSADPKRHDVSVILPPQSNAPRPPWLTLDGLRHPWPISTDLCARKIPCVVDAHYANETDSAVAADRYTFLHAADASALYLRPGAYRLRAWDAAGDVLSEQPIQVLAKQ